MSAQHARVLASLLDDYYDKHEAQVSFRTVSPRYYFVPFYVACMSLITHLVLQLLSVPVRA